MIIGLPGLEIHSKILEDCLNKNYSSIYKGLMKKGVEIHIIIVEWVFSLFSSVIPIELQMEFYFGFFAEGWNFFYKMCIAVIMTLDIGKKENIDADDIYLTLKFGKYEENYEKNKHKIWKSIINNAFQLNCKICV